MKKYQEIINIRKDYNNVWEYLIEEIERNYEIMEDNEEYDLDYIVIQKPLVHLVPGIWENAEIDEKQKREQIKYIKNRYNDFEKILREILANSGYKLKEINFEEWEAFKND